MQIQSISTNNSYNNKTLTPAFRAYVNPAIAEKLMYKNNLVMEAVSKPKEKPFKLPEALIKTFFIKDKNNLFLQSADSYKNDALIEEFKDNPQLLSKLVDIKSIGTGNTLINVLSDKGLKKFNEIVFEDNINNAKAIFANTFLKTKNKEGQLPIHKASLTKAKLIHSVMDNEQIMEMHTTKDKYGNLPMHYAQTPKQVKEYHHVMKDNKAVLKNIHTTRNADGNIPIMAVSNEKTQCAIMDIFAKTPDMWQSLYLNSNNNGNIFAHEASIDNIDHMNNMLLDSNSNLLVRIYGHLNKDGKTPLQVLKNEENISSLEIYDLEQFIIDLALKQNVDVIDSINLLRANNLAPALADYMEYMHGLKD